MEVRLWRHGQVDFPVSAKGEKLFYGPGQKLSATGRAQAARIGAWYTEQNIPVDKIFTSKTRRALQTAEVVARATGAPIERRRGLEAVMLPFYEGEPLTLFEEDGGTVFHTHRHGNETRDSFFGRTTAAFGRILVERADQGAADIVTHEEQIMSIQQLLDPDQAFDPVQPGCGVLLTLGPNGKLRSSTPLRPDPLLV